MLIDDLRRYVDELGRLTTGTLTPAKAVRLVEVLQHLGDLAPQADRLLRPHANPLAGDLWPESDDDDTESEEDEVMGQSERERLLMFMRVIDQSGVVPAAKEDALRRLEQHFADEEPDAVSVRSHLDRMVRGQAPHLWPQT